MKRKKSSGGGGANWMDTYGDMVTLLLCFFVLLYSMSETSEEKWRAIVSSFNPKAVPVATATSGGDGPNADADKGGMPIVDIDDQQAMIDDDMKRIYESLAGYISQMSMKTDISVAMEGGKVFINFRDTIFFAGDSPVLLETSYPVLDKVGSLLFEAADSIDEVRVVGHTAQGNPNRPNNVATDRSLSSQRATNVVVYMQQKGYVDPARLISEGLGQWHPIGDNSTAEGRAQNRRVEMIISGRNLEAELGEDVEQYKTSDN